MPQVLISFDIDENKVAENAEKEAGRQIVTKLFGNDYMRYRQESAMRGYVLDVVREMLEPEKDKIIEEAVKEVVRGISRTKAVKERLNDALEDC